MIDLTAYWTPSQDDFDAFARVSGDDNPIHVDPDFCAATVFGRTVSHGMLIYSKLWGMLMHHDPTIETKTQSMMFPNPAFADEELALRITETSDGRLRMIATRSGDGAECLLGEAELVC